MQLQNVHCFVLNKDIAFCEILEKG